MSRLAIAAAAVLLASPTLAQRTTPGGTDRGTAPSSVENGGPGSDREVPSSGLGSDTKSNNSGASGNAERPELGRPNTGGGGSGGGQ